MAPNTRQKASRFVPITALCALMALAVTLMSMATTQKTIIFYGDSITAGYGLSKNEAFPALVATALKAKGHDYKVVNAGLSGETSAGGLNRLDWILRQPVDIFVLELGANDALRGFPVAETEKNLQAIIDKVKAKNPAVKIVIAGMMAPPNLGQEYTTAFRAVFSKLAKSNKAQLIPFLLDGVAGDQSLNLPDGIHPNVKGHQIVANNVMNVLEGVF